MASRSKAPEPSGGKETILLRTAAPKYNYVGRKLPKAATATTLTSEPIASTNPSSMASPIKPGGNFLTQSHSSPGLKPVAVVGASIQPNISTLHGPKTQETLAVSPQTQPPPQSVLLKPSVSVVGTPVGPSSFQNKATSPSFVSATSSNTRESSTSFPSQQEAGGVTPSQTPQNVSAAVASSLQDDAGAIASATSLSPSLEQQLQAVQGERDKLRAELKSQIQVNTELKRLLVASVGDDLYQRVENLCRDRAQLELDIGGFSKKMSEDYENLDKISIQADMWRSKYLASRVMTEELSRTKAYFGLQCHDSHTALQQLLNERHELRTNLVESYKVLQQVKNAFDPLNTHRSSTLRSTNVLDLSHSCQQLVEAVRFRLLPANVVINVSADVSDQAWQDSLTRAEGLAHEILSRPVDPGNSQHPHPGTASVSGSSLGPLSRYHPAVRHENLTMNCCTHCRGDIQVI